MENRNIFSFGVVWNFKTLLMFLLLLALPNFLGMVNLGTPFGFKIHFFQIAIFIAAAVYGPSGGFLSGILGSVFSAVAMNNPYIILLNGILGLLVGIFYRKCLIIVYSVWLACLIQLPLLGIADYYLVGLPLGFILPLAAALLASNTIWALVSHYSISHIKRLLV